ncbi:uncharacterized protein METZ01_LOCUS345192, partial [marine metagenome]
LEQVTSTTETNETIIDGQEIKFLVLRIQKRSSDSGKYQQKTF